MPSIKYTNQSGSASRRNDKGNSSARGGGGSKGSQLSLQAAAQGQKNTDTTLKKVADAAAHTRIIGPTDYHPKGDNSRLKPSLTAASYAETVSTTSLSSAAHSATVSITRTRGSQSTHSHGRSSRSPSLPRNQGGTKTGTNKSAPLTSIYKSRSPSVPRNQGGTKTGTDKSAPLVRTNQEQLIQGDRNVDNKRRGRSHSPLPTTFVRPQHNQDIRLFTREGHVNKYQGSGSPTRKGKDIDGDDEDDDEDAMHDYSPIQSVQEDDLSDVEAMTLDRDNEMSKPSTRTLDKLKILFAGTFDANLNDWKGNIEYNGGSVTSNLEEADVAVVPNHKTYWGIQKLREKGIPYTNLEGLQKVVEGEALLANVTETSSKVSFTAETNQFSSKKLLPSTPSSAMSRERHETPYKIPISERIPISELKCPPGSTSISSISAAGLSTSSPGGEGPTQLGDTTAGRNSDTTTVETGPLKSTSILNVKITFQQTEDPKETIQAAVSGLLKMLQNYDRSTKIRHLKNPKAMISTVADVPPTRSLYGRWVYFNNATPSDLQPYQNGQQDQKRSISFTIIFESSKPMKALLAETVWDRDEVVDGGSIHIEIKPLQAVETETAFIIIATPTFCSEEDLTKVFKGMLQQGITTAKKKKPGKYSHLPDTLPSFALQSNFMQGLPWKKEEAADREKIKAYMKKPFHIMTKIEDYDIWKVVFGLVERTDNLKLLFGGGAFIIDNRDYGLGRGNRSDDEVFTLEECLLRHIWANRNTAHVQVRGARRLDAPCRIRKAVTDERGHLCDGKVHGYQIDQDMSLREIIMKIKIKGIPVFVLVAMKDGKIIAFHRNTYDEVKDFAKQFESEPAGHIMHWLLKRGIMHEDITNLLKASFSEEEAAGALETKLEGGRVVSQRTLERVKQVSDFDRLNPDVDITQAMRESEITEYNNRQAIIALREAAFHGKSSIDLGEKNRYLDGEGTVYTRKNDTLGDTEFGYQEEENWEDDEDEDEDDFKIQEWDNEKLNEVRVNMSHLYRQEEDDKEHRDSRTTDSRNGDQNTTSTDSQVEAGQSREEEGVIDEEMTEVITTNMNSTNGQYPDNQPQEEAGKSGEETE